jgi:carboxyl-terminal processing protease
MKAILARYRWRSSGYYEVINADDPVINKALETIRK